MKTALGVISLMFCMFVGSAAPAWAAPGPGTSEEIQLLRQEIERMRADYEARIEDLERRLDAAEQAQDQPQQDAPVAEPPAEYAAVPAAPPLAPTGTSSGRDSSFNPAIGVTFQGQAWAFGNDPEDYRIPGFPLGGEAGPAAEGLSLAETEVTMSANVDDKFTAMLTVPLAVEDGDTEVEIEEAWVETLALPAGLSLRMGRFYSQIGYLNTRHFHSWNFADQPLPYQAMLGNQYLDDGLQLRWLAPTDLYLEFSTEVFRGDRYPAGGAANSGFGSRTLRAATGGDVGYSNSWLFGLSWLGADSEERASGDEDEPLLFSGETDLWIADFVWKWSPNGNWRERNLEIQAEYLWRDETGDYLLPGGSVQAWSEDQDGWYVQAIYQPFPRWRFGLRLDGLSGGGSDPVFIGTDLEAAASDPRRYSLMTDWSNSEYSRLRFQYNRDEAGGSDDDQFGLQYIYSIGAHGAHSF